MKETVEENLRLALFVAGDVFLTPCDEFQQIFPARHGEFLHEAHWRCYPAANQGVS